MPYYNKGHDSLNIWKRTISTLNRYYIHQGNWNEETRHGGLLRTGGWLSTLSIVFPSSFQQRCGKAFRGFSSKQPQSLPFPLIAVGAQTTTSLFVFARMNIAQHASVGVCCGQPWSDPYLLHNIQLSLLPLASLHATNKCHAFIYIYITKIWLRNDTIAVQS